MSAGVSDQRMKGQGNTVSNGPKEQLGAAGTGGDGGVGGASGSGTAAEQEFETWRSQQQQQQQQNSAAAHTNPYGTSVPISSATDLYNMSTAGYYGSGGTFPYQAYGVGDGTWSNGQDPMTFLSGYHHDSYSIDGMFGPSTTFSTPNPFGQPSSFNYFHSNGDYNTWGSQIGQRKYDEYYRDQQQNMYTQAMPDSLKSVEQAMQNLDLKSSESKDQKKMTWASVASQPAKPQLPVQSQGLKKKGPGMPPGPIIPGKHNMDIGTWDTNKSTPPQQPPPPPTFVNNAAVPKSLGAAPSMPVRPAWNGPQQSNRGPPTAPRPGGPAPPHAIQSYQPTMMPPHMQPPPSVSMPAAGSHVQSMMQQANMQQPPSMPPSMVQQQHQQQQHHQQQQQQQQQQTAAAINAATHPVLDELRGKNNYNPGEFDLNAPNARFFVIKSYSEDDIHRSIKYEIWCSTEHGNKRLDQAYREREREPNGAVYLFFSVNGSGHFCGMAQMVSPLDYNSNSSVWSQDKWKGQFKVRWVYVKDVPNVQLRYIRLENNENKPVTNSRDTQEVPHAKGLQVLRIIHTYRHSTSIFDDFIHYEKRQEEEDTRKQPDGSCVGNSAVKNHSDRGGGGGGRDGGGRGDHDGRDSRDHHGPNHRGDHRDRERDRGGDRDRDQGGGQGRGGDRGDRGHHRNHHDHDGRHSDHRPSHHGRNHDNHDGRGGDRGPDRGGGDRGDRDRHYDRGHHKERGDRGGGGRGAGGGGGGGGRNRN